jgi:hypothetical protein
MQVPNLEAAIVPAAKIVDYLLSATHPDGKHKAAFFEAFGFARDRWRELEQSLKQHLADHDIARNEPSRFGTRYAVEGIMTTPDGRSPFVRTIWFIENNDDIPRFVTAYPLRRPGND